MQRAATLARVSAQLIDVETNSHLWAEGFDRELGSLFDVQDEITRRIANTLGFQLTRIEAKRAERNRTSPEAMDYVLRGRAFGQRLPSKAIPTYPFLGHAYAELGAAYALKGNTEAARTALTEAAGHNPEYTTIANIRRLSASLSKDPKWLALREQTIIKGLRKAGVPEE